MVSFNEESVTTWLQAAAAGEPEAKEKLFDATYGELRKLAKFMMSNQALRAYAASHCTAERSSHPVDGGKFAGGNL